MDGIMKSILAAAALATTFAFPMVAEAATVNTDLSVNMTYNDALAVTPTDGTATFTFTALEALTVGIISVTGNGVSPNVEQITVSVVPGGSSGPFSTIIQTGSQQVGFAFPSGFNLDANDVFSIVFSGTVASNVRVTYDFSTTEVPLPAAGGMLLLAIAGGAVASRRKKKKA
jgi:opacity protein-like surface antigen